MKGQAYAGFQQVVEAVEMSEDGTVTKKQKTLVAMKKARSLGPRCTSNYCLNSKMHKCAEIDEKTRQELFDQFWTEMDWSQKKDYMCSLVKRIHTKTQTVAGTSRRSSTLVYYLNARGTYLRVCKCMFHSTFGLSDKSVYRWVIRNNPL